MAKITKPLKTIEAVCTPRTVNLSDADKDPVASMFLAQFLKEDIIATKIDGTLTYIPFHAVELVTSQITPTEVDRTDPYGCEDGGGGGGDRTSNIVCEGEACGMTLVCDK